MALERLLARLADLQGTLPDGAFAARIGLSRPAWHGIRCRTFRPGRRALGLILAAFPELEPDVVACLHDPA